MNSAVVKHLKNVKLWVLIVVASLSVWGLAFYWIAQPSKDEKLEIWVGAEFGLKSEVVSRVERVAVEHGIKKCVANSYDPRDGYYAQAFGLRANSVDIYILDKADAENIFETGIFAPIEARFGGAQYLRLDETETVYGVLFVGDYYIFINSASEKSADLLNAVIGVLYEARVEL